VRKAKTPPGPTRRTSSYKDTRVRFLLAGLKRRREELKRYQPRSWVGDGVSTRLPPDASPPLSPQEKREVSKLQQQVDETVLRLARQGVQDTEGYVQSRLSTLRTLGDKDLLRRAHLEEGVRRPVTEEDLSLWAEIERRLGEGQSRPVIRQALIDMGRWRGSRQAFDKLWKQLDAVPMRIRVHQRLQPVPSRGRRPPSSSK
jgi:hypothetical protein